MIPGGERYISYSRARNRKLGTTRLAYRLWHRDFREQLGPCLSNLDRLKLLFSIRDIACHMVRNRATRCPLTPQIHVTLLHYTIKIQPLDHCGRLKPEEHLPMPGFVVRMSEYGYIG